MPMQEYEVVEVATDQTAVSPARVRGAQGVVVDLPPESTVAAVEVDLAGQIDVSVLDVQELRLVEPATSPKSDRERDERCSV